MSEEIDSGMKKISGNLRQISTVAKQGRWVYFLPALLVLYSIMKEIKVGEPFMYKYQTEFLNYTAETLNGEIYPYSAYAYLVVIIPIFLFTDILLYKPIMYLEILGQFAYRFTLVFTNNVFSQQIGQAMYGVATASEVAFFSYIYGRLDKDQYKKLTSWTRAGTMAGRTGGYVFAQLLILFHLGTYRTLNLIAFCVPCVAVVFCFLMPRVDWRHIVNNISIEQSKKKSRKAHSPLPTSFFEYVLYRLRKLRSDFVKIYSNGFIRKWSFWWAMTTCMALQVAQYSQTLFGQVQVGDEAPLNAFADAGYTFTATVLILLMNSFSINWDKWGETTLVIISSLDTVFLILYSQANTVYLMYACYILYRSFYQVMITIAQWNIAKKMVTDSYGLVFGVNSFIALIMQSTITRVVTDKRGLGMQVREAFLVYSALHALIALIFLISVVYSVISYCRNKVTPAPISSRKTTQKSSHSVSGRKSRNSNSERKPTDSTKNKTKIQEPIELNEIDIENTVDGKQEDAKSVSIASELDFSTDEEFESDEERLVSMMPSDTMAASFSASFSKV